MQKTVITFTEHSTKSIQADLGWELSDPRLDQLDRLNALNKDPLFSIGRKTIKASQYVGLVRLGDTALQVLPKIAYSGNFDKPADTPEYQAAIRTAMRNLLVMLSVACDLPLRAQDYAHLHTDLGDWLEILTRMFALELHRQFKAGVPHAYITREDNLSVIRGRWLVGQQFARQSNDRSHFDVEYDEFSPETPLNRVFALTVNAFWQLTRDDVNRRLLADLRGWLLECSPDLNKLQVDLSEVYFSRLNERFRPAFNLAALFWQQRLVQLSAGDVQAFAFVFDMNRLFQEFIAHFILRHRRNILPSAWQDGQVILQAQGQKVYLAERYDPGQVLGQPVMRLIPDILFIASTGFPYLIADTKYKRLSQLALDGGVAESDAYQMLIYARHWNCPQVMLIYPATSHYTKQFILKSNGVERFCIHIIELNLQQPLEIPDGLVQELRKSFADLIQRS